MVDPLFSLGIIFLILAASGLIAWVADGLGKKIGKKRISIRVRGWSMRPKHVASLGTVMMGVVVSGLTIGFIAAVSRDAREWLREGRGLLVQRRELQRNVEDQRAQLGALNDKFRDERLQVAREQDEIGKGQQRVKRLDLQVRGLDQDLRAKTDALGEAKAELAARQALLQRQGTQLVALQRKAQVAQTKVDGANRLLGTARRSLLLAERGLREVEASLRTAKRDTKVINDQANSIAQKSNETYNENVTLNKALEEEVKTRKELVESLKAEEADLVAQRDVAQASYAEVKGQLDSAGKQLDESQRDMVQMQEAFLKFNSGFRTSRTEAMTYRRGEEVARVVVPAEADVEAARNALASLLRTARIEAEARGAKGHRADRQTFEAADVVDRKDPKSGAAVDADTLKRSLVASLTGRPEDQVLVATSSLNAFAGEPVSLDLVPMPNPVVYHRHDTVAETRIDGSLTEDRILIQLSEFVNGPVRQHAAKDRMIPRQGTPAPYGEPSAAAVWSLLQRVRNAGHTVRVQAVAGDDIHAADPLRLEFRVN